MLTEVEALDILSIRVTTGGMPLHTLPATLAALSQLVETKVGMPTATLLLLLVTGDPVMTLSSLRLFSLPLFPPAAGLSFSVTLSSDDDTVATRLISSLFLAKVLLHGAVLLEATHAAAAPLPVAGSAELCVTSGTAVLGVVTILASVALAFTLASAGRAVF